MPKGGSKPGERRGGRQKGTPNKVTKSVREMILGALEDVGGQKYLKAQAEKNPQAFLTLVAKTMPSKIEGPGPNGEHLGQLNVVVEYVRPSGRPPED